MNAAKFYDKRIKTSSEFIKHCYNKLPDGGIVRFSDYYNFLKEDYFEMQFSMYMGLLENCKESI